MNLPWTGGEVRTAAHAYVWVPTWTTANGAHAARRAAHYGLQHVVIPLKDPTVIEPEVTARDFADVGIVPLATSNLGPEADVSSTDKDTHERGIRQHLGALSLARDLGAPHVSGILYSAFNRYQARPERANLEQAAAALQVVTERARQLDLTLSIEIVNRYETNLINTVDQGLELLDLVGADNLYLHFDTFHLAIEEGNLAEALARALPRLAYLELDQNNRGLLSKGALDLPGLLAQVLQAGYSGVVGIEAFSGSVSVGVAAAGVAAWRDLFASGDEVAADAMGMLAAAGIGSAGTGSGGVGGAESLSRSRAVDATASEGATTPSVTKKSAFARNPEQNKPE